MGEVTTIYLQLEQLLDFQIELAGIAFTVFLVVGHVQTAVKRQHTEVSLQLCRPEVNAAPAQVVTRDIGDVAGDGQVGRDVDAHGSCHLVFTEAYGTLDAERQLVLRLLEVRLKLPQLHAERAEFLLRRRQRPFA